MSRAGSSGGGRSSLGYLFEPDEKTTPIHTEKAQENSGTQDGKIAVDEADQEPSPPKREDSRRIGSHRPEDSNPIVSHMPASNIYHTNQSGNNSGLLITVSRGVHFIIYVYMHI